MTQTVLTEAETVLFEVERIRVTREQIAAERAARLTQKLVVVIPEDVEHVDR